MPKPKLYYFDAPVSRGEECRLAFAIAGADFEDVRLSREEWMAKKPTSPFGSVPYLEIDGKPPLAQSNAILGYIGRAHGLHPSDNFEAARHEAMMEHVEDLRQKVGPTMRIQDDEARKAARLDLAANAIPQWGAATEKQLGDGPFFAGAKIHVVDVKLYMLMRWITGGKLDHIPTDVLASCTKLTRLQAAVGDHPAVKAWQAKHA